MAYGDYNGPNKPDKGKEGGSCNRTRCQCSPANWYNHGSYAWYCDDCRNQIQFDAMNLRDWQLRYEPKCGHPMFETREQMDARATPGFLYIEIMGDLVERLHNISRGDHKRGCTGRQYVCSCGYDDDSEKTVEQAAAELLRLQEENARLSELLTAAVDDYNGALATSARIRSETIEECAKIADAMRDKHSSPTGDAYTCGVWDQGVRIAGRIRALPIDKGVEG